MIGKIGNKLIFNLSNLWQSIDSKISNHYHCYTMCYNDYDTQQLYDVHNIAALQLIDNELQPYLNRLSLLLWISII